MRAHFFSIQFLLVVTCLLCTSIANAKPTWPALSGVAPGSSVLGGGTLPAGSGLELRIDLLPSATGPISTGQTRSLTVRFSELDPTAPEIISAFTLVVLYDHSLLTATASTFLSDDKMDSIGDPLVEGTSLTDPSDPLVLAYAGTGFAFWQLSVDDDATLETLQFDQTSFDAIEIQFEAIANGTPEFNYVYDVPNGIDIKGANNQAYGLVPVPIPPAWALIGVGLIGLLRTHRPR